MRVKGFATVAMLTLIIGILVGGIVVFAYFQLNPTSVPSSISSSQATSSPVASPVTDETAEWETYSHAEFNFSIKYPQGWSVDKTNNPFTFNSKDFGRVETERGSYVQKGATIAIYFTTVPTSGDINKDFDGYFRAGGESTNATITGSSEVAGILATEYSYTTPDKNTVRGAFFIHNEKIVTISLVTEPGGEDTFSKTYGQIRTSLLLANPFID